MLGIRAPRDLSTIVVSTGSLAVGITLVLIAERVGAVVAFASLAVAGALVLVGPTVLRQARGFIGTLRQHVRWWHGLWLLVLLSSLNFRPRTSQDIEASPVDSWALFRIVLMGCVAFVLGARLALKRTAWVASLFRGLVGALSAYVVVCVISAAWSGYPAWTLYRSCEYGVDVALLAAILATLKSVESYRTLFDWTLTLYVGLVSSVWLGLLIWPHLALTPVGGLIGVELEGVLPSIPANGLGELAAVLAIVAFIRLLQGQERLGQRALYVSLFFSSLLTLFLSQARSAMIGLAAGVALVLLQGRRWLLVAATVAAPLPLLSGGAREWLYTYFMRGQSSEMFASLSGRMSWWEATWQDYLKSPLTGLGAYTARFEVLARLGSSDTSSVHNTYLEVLFGTSFWGLIAVVAALLGTWWWLLRVLRSGARGSEERGLTLEAIGVLSVVTVRSFFTSHLVAHPSLSFLLVLGCAEFLRRRWKLRGLPS